MNARIIGWEPLEPVITNHVLDVSIPRRNIPLKSLAREKQIKILEERVINSPILKEDSPFYRDLKKGMPKLGEYEKRYYKKDDSPEYPYIYVIKTCLKEKGKEIMLSICWICEFEEKNRFKIGEIAHYN